MKPEKHKTKKRTYKLQTIVPKFVSLVKTPATLLGFNELKFSDTAKIIRFEFDTSKYTEESAKEFLESKGFNDVLVFSNTENSIPVLYAQNEEYDGEMVEINLQEDNVKVFVTPGDQSDLIGKVSVVNSYSDEEEEKEDLDEDEDDPFFEEDEEEDYDDFDDFDWDTLEEVFADGYTPTSGMVSAARRALKWKDEGKKGGTRVGLTRANQIVNKENLSLSTVKRMYSFFSRHEVNKKATGFSAGEEGYPSPGRVAWDLWGGDAGFTFSRRIRNAAQVKEKMSDVSKTLSTVRLYDNDDFHTENMDYGKKVKSQAAYRALDTLHFALYDSLVSCLVKENYSQFYNNCVNHAYVTIAVYTAMVNGVVYSEKDFDSLIANISMGVNPQDIVFFTDNEQNFIGKVDKLYYLDDTYAVKILDNSLKASVIILEKDQDGNLIETNQIKEVSFFDLKKQEIEMTHKDEKIEEVLESAEGADTIEAALSDDTVTEDKKETVEFSYADLLEAINSLKLELNTLKTSLEPKETIDTTEVFSDNRKSDNVVLDEPSIQVNNNQKSSFDELNIKAQLGLK